ncbi:LacI family DNA-binding transcriptional regulator [Caldicoprobacter faecalis]|uniref:Transcriptional regulator, LacI family n=1 Tax=Caldicoprobacter faecalis TaxID=937334 RepID=A0A1I5XJF3_9FIRM|nr:LacI family DNA-binding transcriptional regulator [Caldicoprobacter faecalis]SFQ32064.1 transcriptional regulator, LacI family [Caldicoprobacter faecalis]
MATIYDIAKKAGVSVATVSRVLNGVDHPVREETRKRIIDAARELGYRPNKIAKSLAHRRTFTVALLIPSITNNFYTEIAEVIEQKLGEKGYSTYLCNTQRMIEKETQYVDDLIARRVDGVIFSPTRVKPEDNLINAKNLEELRKNGIAVVAFGSHFSNVSQVYINTYEGALQATRYLLELGHKRIGFIDGLEAGTRKSRRRGYMDALRMAGIEIDANLIVSGNLEMDGGYECVRKLMRIEKPPTAIIAVNNLMAIGALKGAKDMGIDVPGELSIIGFDDSKLSEVVEPPLTVVKQPLKEIGDVAVELLMEQIEGENASRMVELKTQLIIRASCSGKK